MNTSLVFVLAVKCGPQCGRAIVDIFRLIYHYWGITGFMAAIGFCTMGYGIWRIAVSLRAPTKEFEGSIHLEGDGYVIHDKRKMH